MRFRWGSIVEASGEAAAITGILCALSALAWVLWTGAHLDPLTGGKSLILTPLLSSFLAVPLLLSSLVFGEILLRALERDAIDDRIFRSIGAAMGAAIGAALQGVVFGESLTTLLIGALVGAIGSRVLLWRLRTQLPPNKSLERSREG